MNRPARPFTRYEMVAASSRANRLFTDLLETARRAEADTERADRLHRQCCKSCWYVLRGAMAGARMTRQPCARCGEEQIYASTNTNALCGACANEHHLCKHCCGDLDMRDRRRKWPEPVAKPDGATPPD